MVPSDASSSRCLALTAARSVRVLADSESDFWSVFSHAHVSELTSMFRRRPSSNVIERWVRERAGT